jgi:hypothetical protein
VTTIISGEPAFGRLDEETGILTLGLLKGEKGDRAGRGARGARSQGRSGTPRAARTGWSTRTPEDIRRTGHKRRSNRRPLRQRPGGRIDNVPVR